MKAYIGYSTDRQIRNQATSGGVGSALVKYLFDTGIVKYALSFDYDLQNICYHPKLVSSFSDYNICGSIYQEMNLIKSLKEILKGINGGGRIVLFSLPCQSRALREICWSAGFEALIIGLTCSSQQSHEATTYLFSRIGIKEKDVISIRYRGNGWPSGIQIETKDGETHFINNNNSIWTEIFHSRLFIQPKCFSCRNTLNDYADIVLADPWLKEYVDNEKEGQTLFATYTDFGEETVRGCQKAGYIITKEVDKNLLYESQGSTIKRKEAYNTHPKVRNLMREVFLNEKYHQLLLLYPQLFKWHCKMKTIIERLIS